jgi:hypothetical protein
MGDMQTEILNGIEAFARGNFPACTNSRIAILEERVLMLETRRK